ncbi:MAG: glycosyltransferase family 2 protein [Gemmatimonadetes bacterium]|nr:glycosyltransferase family 2 protein [Gemmatimonadota bacterium]
MRVSVIIASYNYGHFVAEAIRSVQEQTVEDLEIIVIDDGSTDDTPEVLSAIRDPRLRAHRIPNSGVAIARNTGLAMAKGEFIAFLDADDRWRPTKLERQLVMMESEPELGLIFTNFVRFNEDGFLPHSQFEFSPDLEEVPRRPSRRGGGWVITGDVFASLVEEQISAWPQTVMVRADRVRGIQFPPRVRICEDLHYMLRVAPLVQAAYITDPLVEVRRHGNNSYSAKLELMEGGMSVYRNLEQESLSEAHREVLRRQIGQSWIGHAYYHYHTRNPVASASAAIRALRYPDSRWKAIKRLALLPAMPMLANPGNVDWKAKPAAGAE